MSQLFWELTQQRHIRAAEQQANRSSRDASQARREIEVLEERLDRLTLGLQALWEICAERVGFSQTEWLEKIREIDLRDGKLDGRLAPSPVECPSCSRPNAPRRARCLYCASELPISPF